MFAFMASTILNEFKRFEPDMLAKMTAIVKKGEPISIAAYQDLPSISFDVAIMEKTSKGVVLPSDFGWSDIGTWNSLYAYMPKDGDGNVIAGDVITYNTKNSLIIAKSRLVAANDISDTAIVETPDAVFVSNLETSRNVKDIVSILKRAEPEGIPGSSPGNPCLGIHSIPGKNRPAPCGQTADQTACRL